ncbi:MAG: CoA pyrophosphatase [Pseudomonadota bacterium]
MVSVARVDQALSDWRNPPADPLDVTPPLPIEQMPTTWQVRHRDGLRAAAVLIALLGDLDSPQVLLTERAHHLQHHPGQISFPGGRVEMDDENLAATALREANEEVGLSDSGARILGYLPTQWTVSGYAMTPVVAHIPMSTQPSHWRLDPGEVASAFEVPAAFLFDTDNHKLGTREIEGRRYQNVEIDWQGRRIWGVTARVIALISQIISKA